MKLVFALLVTLAFAPSIALAGFAPVPEAGSTISLLGLALTGVVLLRRKLR